MRGPREIAFHGCEQLDDDMAECDVKASSLRAAIMDDMSAEASGKDFVLTIVDVFSITGRGTAVIGPIESGVIRTGEIVEVWDGNQLITTARATVELICNRRADPRSIGLMLGDVDKSLLRTGQTIRKPAMTT